VEVRRGVSSRFTFAPGLQDNPIWSPAGLTILYSAGKPDNLFRKEADGGGKEQRLTQGPNIQSPDDWSGDARLVLYTEFAPGTQGDLWILPVTSEGTVQDSAKPRIYLRTPANEDDGRFSPGASPQWVAYSSDESGRSEIYVSAFPQPRGKFQISTSGGRFPQWGAGGRELFYVSPANRLMAVSLKLGSDSVEPSAPRELFPLPTFELGVWRPYEATPDGQRFVVRATMQRPSAPLTVIVNWPALLKRSAAAQ
jgi:Tol biopolymer transport system component